MVVQSLNSSNNFCAPPIPFPLHFHLTIPFPALFHPSFPSPATPPPLPFPPPLHLLLLFPIPLLSLPFPLTPLPLPSLHLRIPSPMHLTSLSHSLFPSPFLSPLASIPPHTL